MIQIYILIAIIFPFLIQSQEIEKNYVQDLPIDGFSLEMVYIPNGSFDMGKDSTKSMDYSPSNKIEVSPFWISSMKSHGIFINYLWIRQILMKKILKGLTS